MLGRIRFFLAKRKLVDSQAPLLWEQLTHTLGELARAYNKRRNVLTIEEDGDQFAIRRSSDAGQVPPFGDVFHLENKISLNTSPASGSKANVAKVIPGDGEGIVCLVGDNAGTGQKKPATHR